MPVTELTVPVPSVLTHFVPKTLSNKVSLPYDVIVNENYKNRNYSLCLDKLILNLVPTLENDVLDYSFIKSHKQVKEGYFLITKELSLKKNPKRIEKNFLHTFDIYISGEHVGELSTDSRIFNGLRLVKLTYRNPVFYNPTQPTKFYDYYQIICKALDLRLNNISYLEIAYDGYGLHSQYKNLYLNSTICEQLGFKPTNKVSISSLHNHSEFIIGSGKTGKAIAIYPKTQDIQANNKGYISVYQSFMGLDTSKLIDRVELRVQNNYIKKYSISLEDLTTQTGLETIFKSFTQDSLSFFDLNTKHYDSQRNVKYEQINLIDFDLLNGKELERKATTLTTLPTANTSIRASKTAYKRLLFSWIATGQPEYYNALKAFISSPINYLTTVTHNYYGNIDLEEANKALYQDLSYYYLKEFNQAPTEEILSRLGSYIDSMFYNFNPNDTTFKLEYEYDYLPF